MKKILIIANPWFPTNIGSFGSGGGVEVYLNNLVHELISSNQCHVTLLTTSDSEISTKFGDQLTKLDLGVNSKSADGFKSRFNFGVYQKALSEVDLSSFDMVMSNSQHPTVIKGILRLWNRPDKLMIYSHGLPIGRFDVQNAARVTEFKDQLLWVSTSTLNAKMWSEYVNDPIVLPLGTPASSSNKLALHRPIDYHKFVAIARIHPEKGLDIFTRLAPYLPTTKFDFIGYSADADKKVPVRMREGKYDVTGIGYDDALLKLMDAIPNVEIKSELTHDRSKLMSYLSRECPIIAHFSPIESGSLLAAEAFSVGLPIMTIDTGKTIVTDYIRETNHVYTSTDDSGEPTFSVHQGGIIIYKTPGMNRKALNDLIEKAVRFAESVEAFDRQNILDVFNENYSLESHTKSLIEILTETVK